jgi:hypothetical protein
VESSLVIIASRPAYLSPNQGPKTELNSVKTSKQVQEEATLDNSQISFIDFSLGCTLKGDEYDILRLTHHYTLCTCKTIADISLDTLPLWRDVVPGLAFNHDFLLHILLAVTALHLNILHPSTENSNAALQHYTKGLALFRPYLTSITPNNISILFIFSCLLPLYSFGINCTSIRTPETLSEYVNHGGPLSTCGTLMSFRLSKYSCDIEAHGSFLLRALTDSKILRIIEILTLLRGVRNIATNGSQLLKSGPMGCLLPPSISDLHPTRALSQDIEATLLLLSIRNLKSTKPSSRDAFAGAIARLRHTFLLERDQPGTTMTIVPFAIWVPDLFVERMRDREPMALVILAHYAVVLHWLRRIIWLQDWGSRIIYAVRDALSEEWTDCMAWPMGQIYGRVDSLVG